jgi:very-short-patch-repair endonuclease
VGRLKHHYVDKLDPPPEAAPPDLTAARVAETQYGVVTLTQLERCGLTRAMVARRVAVGRLRPLHRGVYAFGHAQLRREGRLLAAVFASGPGAVASHRSAADQWGIRPSARAGIDVTVPTRGGRVRRRGIDLHRVRRLNPADVTELDGIPITTVARTLVDLADMAPARIVERALEQSYVHRLLAPGALEDALSRSNGRRTGTLRRLIEEQRTSTITRNDLEERFLAICRSAGLPDPEVNAKLLGYEPDFLWRDRRLIVEADGFGTHSTKHAFEHDRRKDTDLFLAGFHVTRFTHDQITKAPKDTATRLTQLWNAAGRLGVGGR